MTTTLPAAPTMSTPAPESPDEQPSVDLVLVERFPEGLRMSRGAALLVAGLALFFWRLCARPLFHSDLWGHLSYGKWIWEHRSLPLTEPFLPLAQGMPLVDTAWLSQVIGYGIYTVAGPAGLQGVMAACVTGSLAVLAWFLYRRTQRAAVVTAGLFAFLCVAQQQICVGWGEMPTLIRPQIAGVLIFTWMFCTAALRAPTRRDWVLVPLATAVWANLHGSFVMGPLLLCLLGGGRALDRFWRTGRWRAVWRDARSTHWLLIAELSLVAALINPYGLGLYSEVATFARNANLSDLLDWEPITLRMYQGRAMALVVCLLIIVYRLSPRRISSSEFLILTSLGLWALWTSRMLIWWSLPAGFYLALHLNAVLNRQRPQAEKPFRTGLWSVVAVGFVWIGFALSPLGIWALHQKQGPLRTAVSADTPIGAVEYLRKQKTPLRGLLFNTYEWGDYLIWAGPDKAPVFVNSHVHLIPAEVWQSYLSISRAAGNWQDQLDKYGVNYIVIDHRRQSGLSNQLKGDDRWRLGYEDRMAAVFIRKQPI